MKKIYIIVAVFTACLLSSVHLEAKPDPKPEIAKQSAKSQTSPRLDRRKPGEASNPSEAGDGKAAAQVSNASQAAGEETAKAG